MPPEPGPRWASRCECFLAAAMERVPVRVPESKALLGFGRTTGDEFAVDVAPRHSVDQVMRRHVALIYAFFCGSTH